MSNEVEFVQGLLVKERRDGSPEYLIGSLSIKRAELIAWLKDRSEEWINVDLKTAKSGKPYASVNSWKPDGARSERQPARQREAKHADASNGFIDDDLPFAPIPLRRHW